MVERGGRRVVRCRPRLSRDPTFALAYRNDYGGGGNHPRTFELQGSNDGYTWTTLSAHKGESWSDKSAKHWPVDDGGEHYRILRILTKGEPNHLCCSGIEFYGQMMALRSVR